MAVLDLATTTPAPHVGGDEDHRRQLLQRHGGKPQDLVGEGEEDSDDVHSKGVRHLCERGAITRLPARYVLPPCQRAAPAASLSSTTCRLPVIDLARLKNAGVDRAAVLAELDAACLDYGFFQVVNHGVEVRAVLDVARRFFDLPSEQRNRYASSDIRAPVRYGTSFNQRNDDVLCWRDFLKIVVSNDAASLAAWPDAPGDLREVVAAYVRATRRLFRELMDAALEALLGSSQDKDKRSKEMMMKGCDDAGSSSQMLVVNCYPACPEPDLTLGMPPHSDYGLLTILLQDQVKGLEVSHAGRWVLVDPLPGALIVNIGDHFEIFSNGRYKSVLHRVRVNSTRSRVSVASLHSLPPEKVIGPAPELVDEQNPRRYMDTDFEAFLRYITSAEGNHKSFLHSRRIPLHQHQSDSDQGAIREGP